MRDQLPRRNGAAPAADPLSALRDRPKAPAPEPVALSSLLIPEEAAVLLRVSPRTLWSLTNKGQIKCVKIGRSKRYDRHDLAAFIDQLRGAQGEGRTTP